MSARVLTLQCLAVALLVSSALGSHQDAVANAAQNAAGLQQQAVKLDTAPGALPVPSPAPAAPTPVLPATTVPAAPAAAGAPTAATNAHKPRITIVNNVNTLNTQPTAHHRNRQQEIQDLEKTSLEGLGSWKASHKSEFDQLAQQQQQVDGELKALEEKQRAQDQRREQEERKRIGFEEKAKSRQRRAEEDRTRDQHVRSSQPISLVNTAQAWGPEMGGDYSPPRADRWSDFCVLSGLLKGDFPTVIGYLPMWCRPQSRLIFAQLAASGGAEAAIARVDILPDGRIYHVCCGTNNGWLSLSGIMFDVSDRSQRPELFNGWVPYNYGWRVPQVAVINGVCSLSGLVRGNWNNVVARVPAECFPDGAIIFTTDSNGLVARVDVWNDGIVRYQAGGKSHDWLPFDGMIWTAQGGEAVQLQPDWQPFGEIYRPPKYTKIGRLCIVSGLAKTLKIPFPQHMFTLPEDCRPSKRLVFGANVHTKNARIDVLPNGQVLFIYGNLYQWVSLDSIKFITTA